MVEKQRRSMADGKPLLIHMRTDITATAMNQGVTDISRIRNQKQRVI
jgi:hypothetical protein